MGSSSNASSRYSGASEFSMSSGNSEVRSRFMLTLSAVPSWSTYFLENHAKNEASCSQFGDRQVRRATSTAS